VTALYRKYRPQGFDEVVGQEPVVRTLKNAIAAGQVRQAYLFAGPRGTGKTSLARILAKGLNCVHGPTPNPDMTCHACLAIANGSSLDVVEMDAASQRGIDDIREIRERVVLQPAEGRYKVYILDEAHQLTDAAWNALLKLIEEPPPHLVFVFCTTDLAKVLPTVRSRCQTFVFQRPRLPELVKKLRRIADAEQIDVPDQVLALIARGARGAYRDAESTLDQLSAATEGQITVQDVLQLLGAVEEEALFRLCDLVVDGDTAGALTVVEELAAQGQDLGRLVLDLLEHLRALLLVQHMHEVPDSLPLTDESRERLAAQANQLGESAVVRLIDLLVVAVDDLRQGGDPRLPLELALVKVTRPAADMSREALSFRLDQLERGRVGHAPASAPETRPVETAPSQEPAAAPPNVQLDQLQEAWQRSVLPAVGEKSIPTASMLAEARPAALDDETLTIEFPQNASFHRKLAEEPKNATLLRDALYELTGRRLGLVFVLGEAAPDVELDDPPAGEEEIYQLVKDTFDAREVDES
jgi:DNA polymerase-3 subunit gamma/tau